MQHSTLWFVGGLALVAGFPTDAPARTQSVDEVAAMIDQIAARVEAAEALPFAEGSEGAARAQLAQKSAALREQQGAIAANEADIAATVLLITALLPEFPAAPVPSVVPGPTVPLAQTDEPPQNPDSASSDPDPGPPVANVNPEMPLLRLDSLTEPLAFSDRARRVLSRPGAELRMEAGQTVALPAFSVLYVYAEAGDAANPLLAVGRTTRGADGWVSASQTEDWRTMLVMSYAPNTNRDRTVFFSSRDAVLDVLDLEDGSAAAIAAIHEQIRNGTYDPEKIVAIEPALSVDSSQRPYLMPVLDFFQTSTETHGDVTILQLAALNRDSTDSARAGAQPVGQDRVSTQADARDLRVGVAFVIDTTRSMGPYIERVKDFVRDISSGLADRGLRDRFDFALVGYRDNTAASEGVEYLRRIYRDFGAITEGSTLSGDVDDMRAATASTSGWREDAFAGIDLAIGGLDWGQVDTRLVFLITDASPRSVGDLLAANSQMGPETINALANQRNVALFVLHMQTEEAASVSLRNEGYDDTARGQTLYARMAQTGDAAISKYFSVKGETERSFTESLNLISGLVIDQLSQLSAIGQIARQNDLPEDPFLEAITAGGPVVIETEEDAPLVAAAVAGELFRYQTEYLGARSGVEAPDFYRAWAVDKDVANPDRRSLNVSVFVTREQLSDLATRLDDIVTRLRQKELGMGDFFDAVQAQSGSTAVDPSFGSFLPSYLDDLPYGSKFINMTSTQWDSLGQTSRNQLLDEVEAKLGSYKRIYATQDGWIALDDRATEDQVYPLPLRDLP